MKKMNLKFFGLGAKIVLPLFLLIGLFMVSATTVSAQFLPKEEAKAEIEAFISQLPVTPDVVAGMEGQNQHPKYAEVKTNRLRRDFVYMLAYQLKVDETVAGAIESTYKRMTAKISVDVLDPIKLEFEELLAAE